jgi:AcrR family transcriptional regulator
MPIPEKTTYEKTSLPTREKILDAAQTLFTEKGFAATSLRAIADLASVNLAAANYHFGSKEGLLAATIHRGVEPVNEARLSNLDQLESQGDYCVPSIVAALFDPLLGEDLDPDLPRLIARVHGEPASISRPLLEKEFGLVGTRFLAALTKALPAIDETELRWRLHLVIGSMIHILNFPSPPEMESGGSRQEGIEKLKSFAIAGLVQETFNESVREEAKL